MTTEREQGTRTGCPFCSLFAAEMKSYREAGLRTEPGAVAVFSPLNPTVPGHLLVVPVRHVETLAGLDDAERSGVFDRIHERGSDPGSFYLIQQNGAPAQQTVRHIHFHMVPAGKGFRIPWNEQNGEPSGDD